MQAPGNADFLEQEDWLSMMHSTISAIATSSLSPEDGEQCSGLLAMLRQEWVRMQLHKEREWSRQREIAESCEQCGTPFEMKHWLARFLSREKLEDMMDGMLKRALGKAPEVMLDFWDAPVLRELRMPDGTRFIDAPPGEARLVFGLSVDGFNPFHSKTAKQVVTVTAIYMYCLNLPPHLRYRPENVYLVGVIP
ncbi:hypothetical protein L226DRAFT_468115, partial [Lentinus tigrinus ALCF2SS1-7]